MPPIDANVIGWIATIVIVAFGYGKVHQKVSHCMDALRDGLPQEVQAQGQRITRLEAIAEQQGERENRLDSKLDMLLERSASVSDSVVKQGER